MHLHFERRGAGPPLLMIHGLGGSIRSWDLIVPALSRSRELVVIDMPGHGATPPLEGPQTVAAFADAIAGFIDEQGWGAIDLVGSSVGGRLALELSRLGVGRHCVALDPGGFWRGWETTYLHTTLAASVRLVRLLQPVLPFLARHGATRTLLFLQLSAKPWALDRDLALQELRSLATTPVFDAMLQALADGPVQEGATATPGTVTIGWGRKDRLLLPRQAHRALQAFPDARLHWFDDCGHFPQWDRPEETIRVILDATA